MLRRSILQLSSYRSDRRIPIQITSPIPSFLSSRKAFSVESQQNAPQGPDSTGKPPESGSPLPKILVGSVAVGAVFIAAYQTGYLDKYLAKEPHRDLESEKFGTVDKDSQDLLTSKKSEADEHVGEVIANPSSHELNISTPNLEHAEKNIETPAEPIAKEDSRLRKEENQFQVKDRPELKHEGINQNKEEHLPKPQESNKPSDDSSSNSSNISEGKLYTKGQEVNIDRGQHAAIGTTPPLTQDDTVTAEASTKSERGPTFTTQDSFKDDLGDATKQPLLDEYYLRKEDEEPSMASPSKSQDLAGITEDGYISKDGKLILDFLEAIHAAEHRQAELDALAFSQEKKMMKEKYEKELRDARARELMYAERESILDKELNRERVRAAAALKSLQEKLEDKHKMELEEKETEAELEMKKLKEVAKAELAAAIASEKASQIEKMAEANLHIKALCMAFYARSEEARQSHSAHKLALGALALEDALSNGLPIQKEVEALHTYLEGIDKDSLLDLVLSSLPEEARKNGTDTLLQLSHKFDSLKGTLRHFSLIPAGGGGILSHSLAHVASFLKVREANQSGDGIESLINRVESFLAQGQLIEAADELEDGVKGTQAAEVVDNWVRQARNRAITEQAVSLLQSYATSISLT